MKKLVIILYVVEDDICSSIFHIGDQMEKTSVRKKAPAVGDNA
jgi:hypothetical protein